MKVTQRLLVHVFDPVRGQRVGKRSRGEMGMPARGWSATHIDKLAHSTFVQHSHEILQGTA
jgi:hypothetical protein